MTGGIASFWQARRALLLEAFLTFNLSFLAVDILFAHAVNRFARDPEWIPFGFSLLCALTLPPLTVRSWRKRSMVLGRKVVVCLGGLSILVGVAGMAFHLESQFLREQTLKNLVYTAPFIAPLAYAGIGTLLVMNRLYADDEGWSLTVYFGALGGYFGNFVLALCDHAQNGFFHPVEWLAVAAPAFAVGALVVLLLMRRPPVGYLVAIAILLVVQCAVGTLGFGLHTWANVHGPSDQLRNFIHGAPAFAPLLFVNISVLASFGLVDQWLAAKRA